MPAEFLKGIWMPLWERVVKLRLNTAHGTYHGRGTKVGNNPSL